MSSASVPMDWRVFIACWAVAAIVALALGRDVNSDLQHYHFYNAYALLNGRWAVDLAPAGMHSFFHPGLDLPFYLMTRSLLNAWPWVATALQAGYFAALAYLVLAITNLCCQGDAWRLSRASLLVALLGLTGAATLPEAGATQNDIQVGCLVLGALLALLLAAGTGDNARRRAMRLRVLAGLLGGAVVALKLTAVLYAAPLAVAAAIAARDGAAHRLQSVMALALGGVLGFTLVYGPWGWFLWEQFGNPFGPFFNDILRSPWFQAENPRDTDFLPRSLTQALAYPFLWARRSEGLVIEPAMADPRFAIGLSALAMTFAAGAWNRLRHTPTPPAPLHDNDHATQRATWAVIAFIGTSYVIWLVAFSILRYAVAIEVLIGVPVWAAARALLHPQQHGDSTSSKDWLRGARLCVGTVLGISALVTEYPDHSRAVLRPVRGLSGAVSAAPVALPDGSLVIAAGLYVSFLIPFIAGRDIRFVGATGWTAAGSRGWSSEWKATPVLGGHQLAREAERLIQTHPGPVFVLLQSPDPAAEGARLDLSILQVFGIAFDRSSCRPVFNTLTPHGHICRSRQGLERRGVPSSPDVQFTG